MAQWPSSTLSNAPSYGTGMPKPAAALPPPPPQPPSNAPPQQNPAVNSTQAPILSPSPAGQANSPTGQAQPQAGSKQDSFQRTQPQPVQQATPTSGNNAGTAKPEPPAEMVKIPNPHPAESAPVAPESPATAKPEPEKADGEKSEPPPAKPDPQPTVVPSQVPAAPDVSAESSAAAQSSASIFSPHASPMFPIHAPAGMGVPHLNVPHPDMEQVQLRSPVLLNGESPHLTGNVVAGAALAVGLALFVLPLKMIRKGLAIGGAAFLIGNFLLNKFRNRDNADDANG